MMQREWVFYDPEVIAGGLDDLPAKDASKITNLMAHYRTVGHDNPSPACA